MAIRTNKTYLGKKSGVLGLTRVGKCPVCKARVERNYTDIYFPYCGYKCKRIVWKKEEEDVKKNIEIQQRKYEESLERERMRKEKIKLAQQEKYKHK